MTKEDIERFFSRVDKNGPTMDHMDSACWEWQPTKNRKYGSFWYNKRYELSHRFSYHLHTNKDISGLVIRHRCDNSRCCNPDHLDEGTQQDNIDDMMKRKRHAKDTGNMKIVHHKGINHGRARLNEDQLKEIRNLLTMPDKNKAAIARQFKVSRHVINCIDYGKTYK